jgi:hypothetical protein
VLLETHCLHWPEHLGAEGAYGKIIRVELLHKLHDELRYRQSGGPDRGHRARLQTPAPGRPLGANLKGPRPARLPARLAAPHPAPLLLQCCSRKLGAGQSPI